MIYLRFKNVIDFILSLFELILSLPFFLIISFLIKLDSPGPIIFKQKRVGQNGKLFTFYKFRTMVKNADKLKKKYQHLNEVDGPVFKIKDDPRLTRFGKWLRNGADELPQLVNVLKGDMSLVGPRPPTPDEVKKYKKWQLKRLSIKPGITSLWHISGRHKMGFDNWVRSDIYYINNQSLKLDLFILYKTFTMFLKRLIKIKKIPFFN